MNLKKTLRTIYLPVILLLLTNAVLAQTKTITGRIADAAGSGLVGVTVSARGGTQITATNESGQFSLTVPTTINTLVISSAGFATQEVTITSQTEVNVTLQPSSATNLSEVVVVGYGTRRRGDVAGSVSVVSSKDFQEGIVPSAEQLIQGRVPGLQVTTGGGAAGGGSRIRIRGGASLNASNDPLIVIDGMPVDGNGLSGSANFLNTLNPNDIESISVLKDAAATALYGSRASNGVLLITTKKGAPGKLKFNFSTTNSVGEVAKTIDVLSGDEIRQIINADATQTGSNTHKALLGTANTNWQNLIYREAYGSDNTLSMSGGVAGIPFRLSLGYYYQDGVLKTNNFKRYSSSLNLSPRLLDNHLAVNLSVQATHTDNRFADEGAIGSAIAFDPTQPVFADNKFGGYYEWMSGNVPNNLATRNPLALLHFRSNNSDVNRVRGNVQLDYSLHFLPDLHVRANIGLDHAVGEGNDNTYSWAATQYQTGGRFTRYHQEKNTSLYNVGLFYAKELSQMRSKFDILLLHEYQDNKTENNNFPAFSQRGDTIPGSIPSFYYDIPQYRIESYLGQLNYTLANKYILTASIRRDATSRFSPDNRVGYFPAAALAWKIREEFFRNSTLVNDLKLRLSWGLTGQQDIGDLYGYIPRYALGTSTAQYQFGNTFYTLARPAGYAYNKWESTETYNAGLDFAILNNRITGSVDYYQRKTKDLLSNVPVAPGSNFVNEIITNVGNMENEGVEFLLNTSPVKTRDLSWDFGFNVAFNKTRITNLTMNNDPNFKGIDVGGIAGGTGNNIQKLNVGYAPYTFFVYKQVYDKATDKPIEGLFEDINRDGTLDNNDRYYYKSGNPDVIAGLNTQLTFRKMTLGVFGHGNFGNYLYNNVNSDRASLRMIKDPLLYIHNSTRDYLNTGFNNNQYLTDYYIQNASFFKIDNINLGYNFGNLLRNKTTLRAMLSLQNVATFTKYDGLDPEVANNGIDNAIYPRPRMYSLALNLDF